MYFVNIQMCVDDDYCFTEFGISFQMVIHNFHFSPSFFHTCVDL